MTPETILGFWYYELKPKQWWMKDPQLDTTIANRFGAIHANASRCECFSWRDTAHGRLAEIIVLDQFSRNIFRNQPQAFASDPLALALAQEALSLKVETGLNVEEKLFLFLPFMHSESLAIHDIALELFKEPGLEDNLEYEKKHRAIIERFGRYPHRNAILGRKSTQEELEFLKQPGSSF